MIVVVRKIGGKVYIGENICITVVDAGGGKVSLGLEVPRDVPIYREETPPVPLVATEER